MRKMFHGMRFYAVQSRDAGTLGGRAKLATIKIYRANDAGSPAGVISDAAKMAEFAALFTACGENRTERDNLMSKTLADMN